jgi:hypothetical protein
LKIVILHTYLPMKMEQTGFSETSAYKIQTPGNYPEESTWQVTSIQQPKHLHLITATANTWNTGSYIQNRYIQYTYIKSNAKWITFAVIFWLVIKNLGAHAKFMAQAKVSVCDYSTSNCFLALKCVSHVRPTSEDLTVVAYSCISAVIMLQLRICCKYTNKH